ncbi:MAG: hypothetical protein J6A96_03200 [Clostridia bacterium]|nr:hypothetical protein [Clostridia bacterium]
MNDQKRESNNTTVRCVTVLLFVISSLFMFNFYKCFAGFVANGFREPLFMIPLFSSYLLPVCCFLFWFYDFYIKKTSKAAKIVFTSVVSLWATINLVLILMSLNVYMSNNLLGVYDTLYGIFFKFPYDGIIVNVFLIAMQVLRIIRLARPEGKVSKVWEEYKQYGIFKLSIGEYLPLCLLAILAFAFLGDSLNSLIAIENALYDIKYIYLALWLLIPAINLILLVVKPERIIKNKTAKIVFISVAILVNVIFALLLLIFELTSPDFIIHVGKPMFLITFSVSLPIEMIALLLIGVSSIAIYIVKLIRTIKE